jgi:hypothetical protein
MNLALQCLQQLRSKGSTPTSTDYRIDRSRQVPVEPIRRFTLPDWVADSDVIADEPIR